MRQNKGLEQEFLFHRNARCSNHRFPVVTTPPIITNISRISTHTVSPEPMMAKLRIAIITPYSMAVAAQISAAKRFMSFFDNNNRTDMRPRTAVHVDGYHLRLKFVLVYLLNSHFLKSIQTSSLFVTPWPNSTLASGVFGVWLQFQS